MTCPIWGTPAQVEKAGDGVNVSSERAGGSYRVTGSALPVLPNLSSDIRARLTTWILDEIRSGTERPVVNLEVLRRARDRRPLPLTERKERFFRAVKATAPGLDFAVKLRGSVDAAYHRTRNLFGSWTESRHRIQQTSDDFAICLNKMGCWRCEEIMHFLRARDGAS